MNVYAKPEAILAKFPDFPVALSTTDYNDQPVTLRLVDVHRVLVLDASNLIIEQSVVANVYAEMARWAAICEYQAARAGSAYAKWKTQRTAELAARMPEKKTAAGKRAAKQGPTQEEAAEFYRAHEDYDAMSGAADRWSALAGLFGDLKWAVKMKAEAATSIAQSVGGFERTSAQEVETSERLNDYEMVAAHNAALAEAEKK